MSVENHLLLSKKMKKDYHYVVLLICKHEMRELKVVAKFLRTELTTCPQLGLTD
jgi:hypothetical protein